MSLLFGINVFILHVENVIGCRLTATPFLRWPLIVTQVLLRNITNKCVTASWTVCRSLFVAFDPLVLLLHILHISSFGQLSSSSKSGCGKGEGDYLKALSHYCFLKVRRRQRRYFYTSSRGICGPASANTQRTCQHVDASMNNAKISKDAVRTICSSAGCYLR